MSDHIKVKFDLNNSLQNGSTPTAMTLDYEGNEMFQPPAPLLAGAHVAGMPAYHVITDHSKF